MNIYIDDPEKKLSKTQRQKIKDAMRAIYTSDKYNSSERKAYTDEVFKSIHYQEGTSPYIDMIVEDIKQDEIRIKFIDQTDTDKKRKMLQRRLRDAVSGGQGSRKPEWIMYRRLRPLMKVPLPSPSEIKENSEMFKGLLDRMKGTEDIAEYFKMCLEG